MRLRRRDPRIARPATSRTGTPFGPEFGECGAIAQPPLLPVVVPPSEPPESGFFTPESVGGPPESVPASSPLPATHLFVFLLHTGVGAEQLVSDVHSTHDPPEQALPAGLPLQSPSFLHASQVLPEPQTGVGFLHSELPVHWHVWVVVSHVSDPQSELFRHPTHAPDDVSQTSGEQSELDAHARQVCVPVSQIGVVPEQSVLRTQPTQMALNV